jgi:deoxyribodipyrimidine photo-lyase
MAMRKIQVERVQNLNRADVREGDYVLYWMQSSQRAEQNHALEYAVQRANDLDQSLLVVFGLTDVRPMAYNHPLASASSRVSQSRQPIRLR